jgi:hypothetical protein
MEAQNCVTSQQPRLWRFFQKYSLLKHLWQLLQNATGHILTYSSANILKASFYSCALWMWYYRRRSIWSGDTISTYVRLQDKIGYMWCGLACQSTVEVNFQSQLLQCNGLNSVLVWTSSHPFKTVGLACCSLWTCCTTLVGIHQLHVELYAHQLDWQICAESLMHAVYAF